MQQQTMNSKANSNANEQPFSQPLPLGEAVWQLPSQYIKVLCRPAAYTFREEMGKASWGIVSIQFYILIVITVTLSYLAHLIPFSALHTTSAFSMGSFRPFALLSSPYNGIIFILGSFVIGLYTAYLFSKLWHGRGSFLAHTYSLLLCTIPLVTISGVLLLIPATGSLFLSISALIFLLFVYRTVLHVFIVMGVHDLNLTKAMSIVLIIPMCLVFIVMLVLIIATGGEILAAGADFLGGIFDFGAWLPEKREERDKVQP